MGKVINVQMDEDFYNEIIQGGGNSSKTAYIGFEIYVPNPIGEIQPCYRYSKNTTTGDTWEDLLLNDRYPAYGFNFSSDESNYVMYWEYILYHDMTGDAETAEFSNPVKTTDIVESKCYYLDTSVSSSGGVGGGPGSAN